MSYAQPRTSSGRRLTALVAVGIFHVLLIYALISVILWGSVYITLLLRGSTQ